MRNVYAVIGAGYGDEGKGLVTDYLASKEPRCVVVRFNGGAQAGHTVVTPKGTRHVFHHFGSGAFTGAETFLSKYFITSPMFFKKEWDELHISLKEDDKGDLYAYYGRHKVMIDPRSIITVPYDIMLNQAAEKIRSGSKHGSCGMGINETVQRSQDDRFKLTVGDLQRHDWGEFDLNAYLDKIREEYVPERAKELGIPIDSLEYLRSDNIIYAFEKMCREMRELVHVKFWREFVSEMDSGYAGWTDPRSIIFEGAQGLMLDQDHENFPHVTRSKTGLHNVVEMMKEGGPDLMVCWLKAMYVTRCYTTKHGAGPLDDEVNDLIYPGTGSKEETNITNEHQDNFRYARLHIDRLIKDISEDISKASKSLSVSSNLVMTCLDQLKGYKELKCANYARALPVIETLTLLKRACGIGKIFVSEGPTRDHITKVPMCLLG